MLTTIIVIIDIITTMLLAFMLIEESPVVRNKELSVVMIMMALVLLGCLAKMPYDYYEFVRGYITLVSGIVGICYSLNNKPIRGTFLLVVALLFQPIVKIHLTKSTWNIIDIVLAIVFSVYALFLIFNKSTKK